MPSVAQHTALDDWIGQTHIGDCRDLLPRMLAAGVSVQTCVTSPPYYGLRDYGTACWEGGDGDCDHLGTDTGIADSQCNSRCAKCRAVQVDRQIGREASPDEYVSHLVDVFRLVRQILHQDGTLWLNLGDSYANDEKWGGRTGGLHRKALHGSSLKRKKRRTGAKPKDLLGMPWRVAFALQSDGWWVRSEIIWQKPNAMPESVRDRPTKVHEHVFLLTTSAQYFYDAPAIYEPSSPESVARAGRARSQAHKWSDGPGHQTIARNSPVAGRRTAMRDVGIGANARPTKAVPNECFRANGGQAVYRNARSVWTIPTEPFRGAHFATFPQNLVRRCVLAGSRPGDIVLDPFAGSGTVRQVAIDLARRYVGCELNSTYVDLHRLRDTTLGLPL